MKRRVLLYFLLCTFIYLTLCAFEIFILKPVIDMITFKDLYQLIIYIVLFIVVNPIITKIIAEQFKISKLPQEIDKPEI